MNRAPLLIPALGAVLGTFAERQGFAALVFAAILVPLLPAGRSAIRIAAAVAFALGVLDSAWRGHPAQFTRELAPATVRGIVTGDVERTGWGATSELTLDDGLRLEASFRVPVAAGDRLVARGTIEPFDEPRNPGEPSARALAAERGVAGRFFAETILERAPASPWERRAWLPRLRAWAARVLRKRTPEPEASILAGALWGERGALPPALRAEFQETGTVHILVTAGLHLGVIAFLATLLLRAARLPRAPAALATIVLVWAYAALSGAHLPSLRAATMISVALLAQACGARALSWNAYAAAIAFVTLLWPAAAGGASFALSFSCVGAILLFADHIGAWCERLRVPAFAAEAVALTVATQLGVWPLTAQTFLTVAPYAVLANLAVVPCVGAAMMLGLAQIATDPVPLVADLLAALDGGVLHWIVIAVHAVAMLPGAQLTLAPPALWTIAAYDLAALLAALALRRGRFALAAAALVLGTGFVAVPARAAGGFAITMLDVGQGDGIVIRTPAGRVVMVDTGGRLELGSAAESPAEAIGERIVVPYLRRAGVSHVEGIILTHPHGDHVGGCAPILRDLGADWIADGGQRYGGHAFRDCLETARAKHVPIREPRAGDVWRLDGMTLRFLAPSMPYFSGGADDVNENSIVFMLEYRGFRMLFTGDAGEESEARLLAHHSDLRADVLKVGHHGSRYASSEAFVAAVHPALAIISVGRHNHFGHPAERTLEALRAIGATVYRTDRCGALTVAPGTLTSTMISC